MEQQQESDKKENVSQASFSTVQEAQAGGTSNCVADENVANEEEVTTEGTAVEVSHVGQCDLSTYLDVPSNIYGEELTTPGKGFTAVKPTLKPTTASLSTTVEKLRKRLSDKFEVHPFLINHDHTGQGRTSLDGQYMPPLETQLEAICSAENTSPYNTRLEDTINKLNNICKVCGASKQRHYSDYKQCHQCGRFWCLIGSCSKEYPMVEHLISHRINSHKIRTDLLRNTIHMSSAPDAFQQPDDKKCLKVFELRVSVEEPVVYVHKCICGSAKIRGSGLDSMKCGQCSLYCCLIDACDRMYSHSSTLCRHQQSQHKHQAKHVGVQSTP